MNYYRCYIEVKMKDDGTLYEPEEIIGIVDTVFEGSDIQRLTGKYCYDFMSLKLDVAGNNVLLRIPYFKGCQWSQCSIKQPAHTRWYVEKDSIRLFMEEIRPEHVDMETRFHLFEGLCGLIDMLGDEHIVNRQRTITTKGEMIANSENEDPYWSLLLHYKKAPESDSEWIRQQLGFPKRVSE